MNNLLSIVIPTRNREKYCIEAIKHILSFKEDCFELVIKDNSDTDSISDYVDGLSDIRLNYYRTKGRINSVLNMDEALSYAKGEYVCMIGDDDTILPNIFSVAKWANAHDVIAISPKNNPAYFWEKGGNIEGWLITQPTTNHFKWAEPAPRLRKLFLEGIIDYQRFNLPRVYHGLMKREVLDRIKERTGHIIGGLSPDIYLTVSSCFYIDKYVITDFPISIQGACVQSTSVGNPRGRFEDMPHLWQRGDYHWDELIPRYNSSKTIWAETALTAIKENGKDDVYRPLFNRSYFLTAFRLSNKDRKEEIDSLLGKQKYLTISGVLRYYYNYFVVVCKAVKKRLIGGRKTITGLQSWDSVISTLKDSITYLS